MRGLNITDKAYVPQPTSSVVLEFFRSKDAVSTTYDRKDYYVQINLDDNYLNIPGVCIAGRCAWEVLAAYMQSRMYKEGPLAQKCFSHLQINNPPNNKVDPVPWWLAIVISVPLAVITIAIIKIVMIKREKRRIALLEKLDSKKNYRNLE